MKTDSIWYRLFQKFPGIFFELIGRDATEANLYQFASVELKQTAFRIDGIFLPGEEQISQPIFFLEVQFQKDPEFYARFFCEIFLYLRLNASTKPWQAVVVFRKRSLEPKDAVPYRSLLELPEVTRIYLDELTNVEQSLGLGIVKLIVETKRRTPDLVRRLLERARSQLPDQQLQQEVLDLIETIVLYKLPKISRQELAQMFSIDDLKKTRYYREVKEEVREEVKEEIREEVKEEVRVEVQREEALALVMRLLSLRVGQLSPELKQRVDQLSIIQLENLAEALLDFVSEADLVAWLDQNESQAL